MNTYINILTKMEKAISSNAVTLDFFYYTTMEERYTLIMPTARGKPTSSSRTLQNAKRTCTNTV